MADWQYILCHTPDPLDPTGDLEEIGVIEGARSREIEIMRNRAGRSQFFLPINDDATGEILDQVSLGDVRGTVRKCVIVRRNKVDLWSGPIWTIQGSLTDGNSGMTVGCVGWLEYLFHRELQSNIHYNAQLQDDVAFALLELANEQDEAHPVPIFPGFSKGAMAVRSPTFNKGDTFGASLQKLSDVESGFDMDVDPRTRELNLFAWDSYRTLTRVKLGYKHIPNNIQTLGWNENAAETINRLTAVSSSGVPFPGTIVESMDKYGVFESTVNLPAQTAEILIPFVNAELVIKSNPLLTYTIVPKPQGKIDDPAPHLFDDFQIGDQFAFSAKEGFFEVQNQFVRLFGANVSISDDNVETVNTLTTSPAT